MMAVLYTSWLNISLISLSAPSSTWLLVQP